MQKMRECLIIDDDEDDQEIFLMCLNSVSDQVNGKTVSSGVDAIAMLTADNDYTPDYIFLDVNMPKMNGIECLKELRAIERLNNTMIFMYSTTAERTSLAECKKMGISDFIIKPTKISELKERLAAIFAIVPETNS
ncbi:MAG: response regulator receiver protein [Flavipsychrobacter sp.]|nr:response regulator receiver protein [Flavipsychrobacter sp.]